MVRFTERTLPDPDSQVGSPMPTPVAPLGVGATAALRGGRADRDRELDFEALLMRIHPAALRVAEIARSMPALIVLWDVLALGDRNLRSAPLEDRHRALERMAALATPEGARLPEQRSSMDENGRSLSLATIERPSSAGRPPSRPALRSARGT